ncbi:Phage small terminase subunit [Pseudomonas aeruginosa]|nr:Phage small terminase subunit [Pseudomonas aeruginosa]
MDGLTSYELMLAKLQQDQLRLKQVQSQQNKAKVKAELLPDYAPYVEGVLAAGQGAQDDVLVTIMVWRFDAEDYAGGLDIAEYVLRHNLQTPTASTALQAAWWPRKSHKQR